MDNHQLPQTGTVDEERARRRQESMNAIMQAAEIATENISKIIASRILESGINHQNVEGTNQLVPLSPVNTPSSMPTTSSRQQYMIPSASINHIEMPHYQDYGFPQPSSLLTVTDSRNGQNGLDNDDDDDIIILDDEEINISKNAMESGIEPANLDFLNQVHDYEWNPNTPTLPIHQQHYSPTDFSRPFSNSTTFTFDSSRTTSSMKGTRNYALDSPQIQRLIKDYANWSIDNPKQPGAFKMLVVEIKKHLTDDEPVRNLEKAVENRVCSAKKKIREERERAQIQAQQANSNVLSMNQINMAPFQSTENITSQHDQMTVKTASNVGFPHLRSMLETNTFVNTNEQTEEVGFEEVDGMAEQPLPKLPNETMQEETDDELEEVEQPPFFSQHDESFSQTESPVHNDEQEVNEAIGDNEELDQQINASEEIREQENDIDNDAIIAGGNGTSNEQLKSTTNVNLTDAATSLVGKQFARRSVPFTNAEKNPENPGWKRQFARLVPDVQDTDIISTINVEDNIRVNTNLLVEIETNRHAIKNEMFLQEDEDEQLAMERQFKMEPRSEFDELAETMPPFEGEADQNQDEEEQNGSDADKTPEEEVELYRPPPVLFIPKMPKVRIVIDNRPKKKRARKRNIGENAQSFDGSSRLNSNQPVDQSPRVDIDDEVLCHSPSPQTTTPTTSFASNSRRRGTNEDVMTLKTCAEIMPQRVADKLQGLPTCKECNREYTREAYNLHMLSQHGTFVGITSKQILTHVRTLCQEAFARIVWRCECCREDFETIQWYGQHVESEAHLGKVGRTRTKKYTYKDIIAARKEMFAKKN